MAAKIVVIGSVNGAFRELFSKLSKAQSKNNFSFAIITGDLFGDQASDEDISSLLQGSLAIPLPTYFSLGKNSLPDPVITRLETGEDVCTNLFFLGRRGTYKTTEGIRIVTMGGTAGQQNPGNTESKYSPSYVEGDVRALHGTRSADILLTYDWPLGIKSGSKVELSPNAQPVQEQQAIADLSVALKPRYHLSSSESFFYEREPFFHVSPEEDSLEKPVTRFISLASFNNQNKEKWLYAFSLDPKAPVPTSIPTGATICPLASSKKRSALPSQGESYSRFNGHDHHEPQRKRRKGPVNRGPEECFFCLSNENIATHMICSIGDEAYVTVAKGPLPLPTTFPALGFPMHMLILPFAHASKFHDIQAPSSPSITYNEMQHYRLAIYEMITAKAGTELGAVCWEVSRKFVRHFVWQLLPVSADQVKRGLVEAAFKLAAENSKLPAFTKFPPKELVPAEKGDYFRLWTWYPSQGETTETDEDNDKNEKSLILQIDEDVRFDIQFGRKVMANLLKLESRTSWQDAAQSVEEETAATETFKDLFKPYDFAQA